MLHHPVAKLVDVHRPGVVVALTGDGAKLSSSLMGGFGFDAFEDHGKIERAGNVNHSDDEISLGRIGAEAGDE